MAIHQSDFSQFAPLFENPNIAGMLALKPKEFEQFVAYAFMRAGYGVTDVSTRVLKGVDIELYLTLILDASPLGGVEVKRYAPGNLVDKPAVQLLLGAPLVHQPGGVGFLITTSDFTPYAYEFAHQNHPLHLLNGERFVRYINYIRGSVDDQPDERLPPISPTCILRADELAATIKHGAAKIIAVANNKGGVGKTTTARYLGQRLAQSGQRVLLVDMDPQANLTQFALNVYEVDALPKAHLGSYFAGNAQLKELAYPSTFHPLMWIIPSHPQLGKRDTGGSGRPDVELDFARDLVSAFASQNYLPGKNFDFIILDTPPAVSLFTRSALAAADYVLIPARARDTSYVGTQNLLTTRETMGELVGHRSQLLGGVITHWQDDATSKEPETRIQTLLRDSGSDLFRTKIPMATAIEGNNGHTPYATHALRAYDELVGEVLALCQ